MQLVIFNYVNTGDFDCCLKLFIVALKMVGWFVVLGTSTCTASVRCMTLFARTQYEKIMQSRYSWN